MTWERPLCIISSIASLIAMASTSCVELSIHYVGPCYYKPSLMITYTPPSSCRFSCIIKTRVNIALNISERWMPPLLICIDCLLLLNTRNLPLVYHICPITFQASFIPSQRNNECHSSSGSAKHNGHSSGHCT
jgi:hypothetical protein